MLISGKHYKLQNSRFTVYQQLMRFQIKKQLTRTYLKSTESDFATMLGGLQGQVFKKTWNVSILDFCNYFVNATQINGYFTKAELITAIKPVLGKLNAFDENVYIRLPENKHQIVTKLSKLLGDGSELKAPTKMTRKLSQSLSALTKQVVRKIPENILCAVCATHIFPIKLKAWYESNPFGEIVNIDVQGSWYAMPECRSCAGHYIFMILDSYRQLC